MKKVIGETEYSLRIILLGGYVQMHGDLDPASSKQDTQLTQDPRSFVSKTVAQKLIIISAGVVINLIVGILLFTIYLGLVNSVVLLPKVGNYKFIGGSSYPNLIELTKDFRSSDATAGYVLTIADKIPTSRADLVNILKQYQDKKVDVKLLEQNNTIEVKELVLNTSDNNIASNLDLKFFPNVDNNDSGRLIITDFKDDSNFGKGIITTSAIPNIQGTSIKDSKKQILNSFILRANGEEIYSNPQFLNLLNNGLGKTVNLDVVNSEGKRSELSLLLPTKKNSDGSILGISNALINSGFDPQVMVVKYDNPIVGGPLHALNIITYNGYALFYLIKDAINGKPQGLVNNVGGIVAIGGQVRQVVSTQDVGNGEKLKFLLNLTASISVILASANILPIPMLDGGHILFILLEKLRGKPLSARLQDLIYGFFFIVIILLALVITIKDILHILPT